jgi:excisionase family DNA binding protein
MQSELMRPGEVRKLLGVSDVTLRRWHQSGQLVARVYTLGGHMRFRRSDVDALVVRRRSSAERGAAEAEPIPLISPVEPPSLENQLTEEDIAFLNRRIIPRDVVDRWLLKRFGRTREQMRKELNEMGRAVLARQLRVSTSDLRQVCKRFSITYSRKRLPPWIPPHLRRQSEQP